jgi:acyl-CoA thioester hydrolase
MRHYRYQMPTRWGDMDAMGHINNTLYFRYFEQARIAWFEEMKMLKNESQHGPILASASCDFLKPLKYPGDIYVDQIVTRLGRSSVAMDLSIERLDEPGQIYARGTCVIVWMDYSVGRALPWPEDLRLVLTPATADSVVNNEEQAS